MTKWRYYSIALSIFSSTYSLTCYAYHRYMHVLLCVVCTSQILCMFRLRSRFSFTFTPQNRLHAAIFFFFSIANFYDYDIVAVASIHAMLMHDGPTHVLLFIPHSHTVDKPHTHKESNRIYTPDTSSYSIYCGLVTEIGYCMNVSHGNQFSYMLDHTALTLSITVCTSHMSDVKKFN